uniref:Uncharacterized protein n=1 Tax=Pyxicephalus adspersus TaxID=30357 RepID=A0AAV3A2P3_PYXAD|nr:TPA: hypothetical protein GDO54_018006 [Pyxicephalus adspersus]
MHFAINQNVHGTITSSYSGEEYSPCTIISYTNSDTKVKIEGAWILLPLFMDTKKLAVSRLFKTPIEMNWPFRDLICSAKNKQL